MKTVRRSIAFILIAVLLAGMVPQALAAASYTGTINADKVFFRLRPSTSAVYYYQLKKGTKVTVTGVSGDFYKVTHDQYTGYVMKKYVSLSSSAQKALNGNTNTNANTNKNTNNNTNVSTSKYANITSISKLGDPPNYTSRGSSGDSVEKLQQALKIKKYYTGVVDGKFGPNTEDAVKRYQKAMGLPQTGKADYATINKLFGKVLYTTVANDPKMNGITKISQIAVPATSKRGDSGKNVLALQQALKIKGYYKAPIDSKYGEKTMEAVKAFQRAKGLAVDGIAGNTTIKALFGKNAANYTYVTERLDWFSTGVHIFNGSCTYTIKDVYTGKTFKAQRRFGSNHLDTEPLTAADTATLKSIYGGTWSWTRRPILVLYNGHVYAASMNGMPHGTCSITNNNFDGHFCIHFYNSRTHETNRVDEDHQSCVLRAMSATW